MVVSQILYSSTKEHLNEFAVLRAVGSSRWYIQKVILWQALLSAIIGYSISAGIGFFIVKATAETALPIVMTLPMAVDLFVLTVVMCTISALGAIVNVTRIDPVMAFTR